MNKTTIPFTQTGYIQESILRYLNSDSHLNEFIQYPFSIDSIPQIIEEKKKQSIDRKILFDTIESQYQSLPASEFVKKNISSLKNNNTFTITTAHQPNLLLGPLYVIYKIASTIKLSIQLNEKYNEFHFLPIYWIGSEDHDVEELAHFNLFGKKIEWNTDNTGAFGRKSTASLQEIRNQLQEILKNDIRATNVLEMLDENYFNKLSIKDATRSLINFLFGKYGLVIVDGDSKELKNIFTSVVNDELICESSFKIVTDSIKDLSKAGIESQAMPREINLFYLTYTYRERIIKEGNYFRINHQDIKFSEAELLIELKKHPEKFSPNVILRPLYQEKILPNIAFIGGGAEVSYWMQLKNIFQYHKIHFPMLVLRDIVLLLDENSKNKIEKLDLNLIDLFKKTEDLVREFISNNSSVDLDLEYQKEEIRSIFNKIKTQLEKSDPTLITSVESELVKTLKSIELLEDKLRKSEKKKLDTSIQQIHKLKEKLFPNNALQERFDNFLEHYIKSPDDFIENIIDCSNVFETEFKILSTN
jgi:bacillithiol biosynthesis cysteine-adding enzyme BshC